MAHYAAFDVSDKETAIHVLDEHGRLVWKGKRPSEPEVLATALRRHAPELERVGLETGQLAPWLYHSLKALGMPVVCLDARHARAATALQRNKTDARDAETLAQLVRTGWYREARVKSWAAHAGRHLVGARAQLVGMATDLSNQIRSLLRTFGLRITGRAGGTFEAKVREQITDRPEVAAVAEPLLAAWRPMRDQIAALDRKLIEAAKSNATCRLLMTCPGVGVVVASSFSAAVEAPGHFRRSRAVGAYLGLTPRRHQSGEVDRMGEISRWGDGLVRTYLFEAATVLLRRVKRWSPLKAWAVRLAQRAGATKARVALARKLAAVMHAIWRSGEPFRWTAEPRAA